MTKTGDRVQAQPKLTAVKSTGQCGAIEQHLLTLPADAPIRALISTAAFEQQLAGYEAVNQTAITQQANYKALGHSALLLTTLATLMAALTLLPLDSWLDGTARTAVTGLQSVANFLAMLLVWRIARKDYVEGWMETRATAERLRGALFERLLAADATTGTNAKRLWREKLDLFMAAHVNYQLGYFDGAIKKAQVRSNLSSWPKTLSVIATLVVSVIAAIGIANYARDTGMPLPPWLDAGVLALRVPDTVRWQLGLNTLAAGLLAYASTRTLMYQDASNLALYRITRQRLVDLKAEELAQTEIAADQGEAMRVLGFCRRAQAILEADNLAWKLSRPPADTRR